MRKLPLILASTLAAAVLAACQAAPAPSAVPGMVPGTGTIAVAPSLVRGATRQLLAVVSPWTEADIDHLTVKFYHPSDLVTPRKTLTVGSDELYNTLYFTNLEPNKTYKLTAEAFSASESISALAELNVAVGNDDQVAMGNLAIALKDVTFAGEATSTGLTVNPGGLSHGGTEGGAQVGPMAFDQSLDLFAIGTAAGAVVVDADGNRYVSEPAANRIWKIPFGSSTPAVFAGNGAAPAESTDGTGTGAHFNEPRGMAIGADGHLYVGDKGAIRQIDLADAEVRTVAGDATELGNVPGHFAQPIGNALLGRFDTITAIAPEPDGGLVFVDQGNNKLRRLDRLGQLANASGPYLSNPHGVVRDRDGKYLASSLNDNVIYRVPSDSASPDIYAGRHKTTGHEDGPRGTGTLTAPKGLAMDAAGRLFIAEDRMIRRADQRGALTSLAGDPEAAGAAAGTLWTDRTDTGQTRFQGPAHLFVWGTSLYFADGPTGRVGKLVKN